MRASDWNPEQYERFREERSQPFFDLLALVRREPAMRVVDLGCGTGNLTRLLHDQLQAVETVGLDNSEAMLAKSAPFAGNGVRFQLGDVSTFIAEHPYDLVFSNAALHWVAGQEQLLARLTAALGDRGQLAVQVPANHDHPSHAVARALAAEEPFRTALGGYRRAKPVLEPEEYATVLDRLGYRELHVRLQVYTHHLPSRDDVVEWVKGTLLVDYQQRLSAELYVEFLERYRARLLPQLADTRPYFYPFKRILFWARKN
jgi:trans-aconitate 2-methyltransferase